MSLRTRYVDELIHRFVKFRLKSGQIGEGIMRRVTLTPDGMSRVFECRHARNSGGLSQNVAICALLRTRDHCCS